jgi:iron(III) transport system substrate-binding protein
VTTATVVATLLFASACGGGGAGPPTAATGGAPITPAALAAYRGADRQQLLEDRAKQERSVTWYTSIAGDTVTLLANAFKAKYPFITQVDIFRGAENEIITRATNEAQAGQPSFDAVESPPTTTILLADSKIVIPFFSPSLAGIPDAFKSGATDGLVSTATVRLSFIGFAYNTTLIPEAAVPKTTLDLLNPALAGKLSLAGSTTGKRWLGSILQGLGEEKGRSFLTQFAAQQRPTVQQVSGKALLDLIAKGEVPASTTIFRDHVEQAVADKKAPVKWIPLDPVVVNVGQAGFAAKATHPAAGLLFLDFLLGTEGQRILRANGYTTADQKVAFPIWIPEAGKTADQVDKDAQRWDQLFTATFRR